MENIGKQQNQTEASANEGKPDSVKQESALPAAPRRRRAVRDIRPMTHASPVQPQESTGLQLTSSQKPMKPNDAGVSDDTVVLNDAVISEDIVISEDNMGTASAASEDILPSANVDMGDAIDAVDVECAPIDLHERDLDVLAINAEEIQAEQTEGGVTKEHREAPALLYQDAGGISEENRKQKRWFSILPAVFAGLFCITAAAVIGLFLLSGPGGGVMADNSQAVMLYMDGDAFGYAVREDALDLQSQYEALRAELAADGISLGESSLTEGAITHAPEDAVLTYGALYNALVSHVTEGCVRGYSVCDKNGTPVLYAETEEEILSARARAIEYQTQAFLSCGMFPADAAVSVVSQYTVDAVWVELDRLSGEDALFDAFCYHDAGETPPLLAYTVKNEITAAEILPYETDYIQNDEMFNGVSTMVSEGRNGLAYVDYTVSYDLTTGEVLSRTENHRTVRREAVNAVAYEGEYSLPEDVCTGDMQWPLPALGDRDLPLDEDGAPYVPQNPLALKQIYVSSLYGERDLWGTYDFHLGLDIVAPVYTEIYASDGGVVTWAQYSSSYGYMVRIRHAGGVETLYAHQSKLAVEAGDIVERGQVIGYVGASGNVSGCHLHFEVRYHHVATDPLAYIEIPEDVMTLGDW